MTDNALSTLSLYELYRLRERYSEEQFRVRFGGPRYNFLESAIQRFDEEIDSRTHGAT